MTNHDPLPRSTPEARGVSSSAISAFIEAIEQQNIELHSMMLIRHGHVIAEGWWSPYSADRIHQLYSLSKSFTSTAIGIAIDEGRLSVDDLVLSFFPDKQPEKLNEHLATMQVHHLLTMSTGHLEDALGPTRELGNGDWVAGFFSVPPDQEPGSIFTYNNAATFMLSAILQSLTGVRLVEYLRPRLFEPLGISQAYWYQNPQGINYGFSGLHITTEAIARLGQLYLQKGKWQGEQLVSKAWVETATTKHIATDSSPDDEKPDWSQGYGYQFWQCRNNAYRADGAFGQFCLVMPEQNAVLATTAGNENMQAILDLVWEHLLPAMSNQALPDNVNTQSKLARQLERLAIQPAQGKAASQMAATVSGKTYVTHNEDDESSEMTLHFHKDTCTLIVVDDDGEHSVRCGYNGWTAGTTTFLDTEEVPIVSSGAWTADDVFRLDIRYIQTPHCLTIDFHFDEDDIRVKMRFNVNFGPLELPQAIGRVKAQVTP